MLDGLRLSSGPGRPGLSSRPRRVFDYSSSESDTESDSDTDSDFSSISDSDSDSGTDSDSGGDSSSSSDSSSSAGVDISEHSNWSDNNAFVVRSFILRTCVKYFFCEQLQVSVVCGQDNNFVFEPRKISQLRHRRTHLCRGCRTLDPRNHRIRRVFYTLSIFFVYK